MRWTSTRTVAVIAAASSAMLVGWLPLAGPAGADPLPFTDQNAKGYIGFCDAQGHQIKSGVVGAAPFVAKAVSSTPAPAGFEAGRGKGVLNVYQPRKEVDPGEWSGKQLTAASMYTNSAHPMAQGTGRDPALIDFVSVFPPKWDGLVQLRMYLTAPNRPMHSSPYPATVVRVKGDTWTVVSGGAVSCNSGTATSVESIALPSSILNKPTARSTPGVSHSAGSTGPASGRPGAGTTSGTSSGSAHRSEDPGQTAAAAAGSHKGARDTKSSGNGRGTAAWLLLAVAAVAGAATAFVRWRRSASA